MGIGLGRSNLRRWPVDARALRRYKPGPATDMSPLSRISAIHTQHQDEIYQGSLFPLARGRSRCAPSNLARYLRGPSLDSLLSQACFASDAKSLSSSRHASKQACYIILHILLHRYMDDLSHRLYLSSLVTIAQGVQFCLNIFISFSIIHPPSHVE